MRIGEHHQIIACNNSTVPYLYEVSGRLEVEGAAAPQQDDEQGAEELCEEGGQEGHPAGLFQVGNADNVFARHSASTV